MPLNKTSGNMYPWVTHTWNTVKGKCPHDCSYCYCKKWGKQPELHFDEKELKTDLGEGNFIFVGSSCDMWAETIFPLWIFITVDYCKKFNNRYLFQTKNPARLYRMSSQLPPNIILGTTIETDRIYPQMGEAPTPLARSLCMKEISKTNKTLVTVEPIIDFNLEFLVHLIKQCHPKWVNIGADSQNQNLPEPSWDKVQELITELKKFTEVKEKKNLNRLKA